jgi:uncharacterized protein (TIGR02246 family)
VDTSEHAGSVSREDDSLIRELIAAAEASQNDVEPFIALHAPDVVIVNIAGVRVLGRDDLRRRMEQALKTRLAKVRTATDILNITQIAPGVAIVSCVKNVFDENVDDGGGIPSQGSLTYAVVKRDGRWLIALAHTTPTAAG